MVGIKKFIIGSIKDGFSSLDIVPGNVVGVFSILVSSKSILVVKFSLGKFLFGLDVSIIGSFKSFRGFVEESLSNSKGFLSSLEVSLGVQDSSGGNSDNVLGGSEVSLGSVGNFDSLVVLVLKFIDGSFSSGFLLNSEVKSKLSFSLSGLFSLGEGLLDSDDFQGVDDSFISCNLLSFNLIDVIDNTNISVRDVNDVVG